MLWRRFHDHGKKLQRRLEVAQACTCTMAPRANTYAAGKAAKRGKGSKERVADQLEFASQAIETFNTEEEKKKWLQTHDVDGSGNFQRGEFTKLLQDVATEISTDIANLATTVPDSLLDKIYKERDSLDVDEVYMALKRCMAYIKSQAKLHDLFKEVDNDNNGFLNEKELLVLLQKGAPPGYKVVKDDVEFVIKKCDKDRDGRISLHELGPAIACWMEVVKTLPPQKSGSSACVIL